MEQKTRKSPRYLFVFMLLLGIFVLGCKPVRSQAASYKYLPLGYTPVKEGNYYFKVIGENVYISNSRNGSYQKIKYTNSIPQLFSNGKQAYFISYGNRNYLCKCVFSTKKTSRVLKLPKYDGYGWMIRNINGNNLFLISRGYNTPVRVDTYFINLKTNRLKLLKGDYEMLDFYNNYTVGIKQRALLGEYVPSTITIYRFTGSSLKKVKAVATKGQDAAFGGGYLYFTQQLTSHSFTIYRCRPNGTGVTKIHTVNEGSQIDVWDVTAKYCDYMIYSSNYPYMKEVRYMYSTGKETTPK